MRSHIPGLLPWVVGQWQITGTFGRWTAGLIGAWLLFVLATGIGEGYHYTTIWLTVAVGFLLQFVGTWLGRPRDEADHADRAVRRPRVDEVSNVHEPFSCA